LFGVTEKHVSLDSLDFYEKVDAWDKWKKEWLNLNITQDVRDHGVLVLNVGSGVGDAFAAALANKFSYILGSPNDDVWAPRFMSLKMTTEAREQLLTKELRKLNGSKGEILVLPISQGNDFDYYLDSSLSPSAKIEADLSQRRDLARWAGSPFVFVVHTQVLGTNEGLKAYSHFLESSKDNQVRYMTAQDYLNWWSGKSSLEMKLESYSETELVMNVSNVGVKPIKFANLAVVQSGTWKFEAPQNGDRFVLEELLPGKSIQIRLKKRAL
jgi:hypothetical protein